MGKLCVYIYIYNIACALHAGIHVNIYIYIPLKHVEAKPQLGEQWTHPEIDPESGQAQSSMDPVIYSSEKHESVGTIIPNVIYIYIYIVNVNIKCSKYKFFFEKIYMYIYK